MPRDPRLTHSLARVTPGELVLPLLQLTTIPAKAVNTFSIQMQAFKVHCCIKATHNLNLTPAPHSCHLSQSRWLITCSMSCLWRPSKLGTTVRSSTFATTSCAPCQRTLVRFVSCGNPAPLLLTGGESHAQQQIASTSCTRWMCRTTS